eukprot:7302759-Ditylum_brightwellii.AAC.1
MTRKKDSSAIAAEGSLSVPLIVGLERHVKRGRHATVEENKSDESQSIDSSDLDEDGNAYANTDNAASDEEDGNNDSDDFYASILGDDKEWKDLTLSTNILAISDYYMSPHGLKAGIAKNQHHFRACI